MMSLLPEMRPALFGDGVSELPSEFDFLYYPPHNNRYMFRELFQSTPTISPAELYYSFDYNLQVGREDTKLMYCMVSLLELYASGQRASLVNYLTPNFSVILKDMVNDLGALIKMYMLKVTPRYVFLRNVCNMLTTLQHVADAQIMVNLDNPRVKIYTLNSNEQRGDISKFIKTLYKTIYEKIMHASVCKALESDLQLTSNMIHRPSQKDNPKSKQILMHGDGRPKTDYLAVRQGFYPLYDAVQFAGGFTKKKRPYEYPKQLYDIGEQTINSVDESEMFRLTTEFLISMIEESRNTTSQTRRSRKRGSQIGDARLIDNIYLCISKLEETCIAFIMRYIYLVQYMCNFGLSVSLSPVVQEADNSNIRRLTVTINIDTASVKSSDLVKNTNDAFDNLVNAFGNGDTDNGKHYPITGLTMLITRPQNRPSRRSAWLIRELVDGASTSQNNNSSSSSSTNYPHEVTFITNAAKQALEEVNVALNESEEHCKRPIRLLYDCLLSTMTLHKALGWIYETTNYAMKEEIGNNKDVNIRALPPIYNISMDRLAELINKQKGTTTEDQMDIGT
jgi:hypothetical protein